MFCSRKQIIKGVKFFSGHSGGIGPKILKNLYQTKFFWYAKLAGTSRKFFIVCDCVSSHPKKPYLICKSRLRDGNLIRKWSLNKIICMLDLRNVIMKGQFLIQTIIIRRPLVHPKLQYDLCCHATKSGTHQKHHESVPQKFFLQWTDYVTEEIRITIRNMIQKWAWNSITLFLPTLDVQNTIYVTNRSLIGTTTTDIECLTQHQWCPNSSEYSLRNTYVRTPGMPRNVLRKWYG